MITDSRQLCGGSIAFPTNGLRGYCHHRLIRDVLVASERWRDVTVESRHSAETLQDLRDLVDRLKKLGPLSALGRHEEALVATQESVEIRRRLAAARPDAFLPDLAMSLNNLGAMLSELGRREEAIEVLREVTHYYVAFARITPQAFLNNLLIVLRNLVENLQAAGQALESDAVVVEAVQFLQSLKQGEKPTEPS